MGDCTCERRKTTDIIIKYDITNIKKMMMKNRCQLAHTQKNLRPIQLNLLTTAVISIKQMKHVGQYNKKYIN